MKRNFVVSLFGGFFGSALLLIMLSVTGIVGARGASIPSAVVRSENPNVSSPLTSTFNFQGQLKKSGSPLSGTCDFQFGLWDSLNGGAQIGVTQTVSSLSVNAGAFIAQLNSTNQFGATAFTGNARWLQIAVKCAGDSSFNPLSPRTTINATPYALSLLPGAVISNSLARSSVLIVTTTVNLTNSVAILGELKNSTVGVGSAAVRGNNYGVGQEGSGVLGVSSGYGAGVSGISLNGAGVFAQSTTGSGVYVESAPVGIAVISATVHGVLVDTSLSNGVSVYSAGQDGIYVGSAGQNGVAVDSADINGVYVNSAVGTGVYVNNAGLHGVQVISAQHDGVYVGSAGETGVYVNSAGSDGVYAEGGSTYSGVYGHNSNANSIGVKGEADVAGGVGVWGQSNANTGVYGLSTSGYGVWGQSTSSYAGYFSGNVRVTGKLTAVGGFNGTCRTDGSVGSGPVCNQDMAESFNSSEQTEPGDLVTLVTQDTALPTVHKSTHSYEGLLVGVVSQNPGLIFDNGQTNLAGDNSKLITADKTVVALVGRANVKVSMENGFIAIGDSLTSSSTPGLAMKATRAGKIVGYAMASANANGSILALVQPGYYLPTDQLPASDSTTSFNWFNLLSAIAFGAVVLNWIQQHRSKRGQA